MTSDGTEDLQSIARTSLPGTLSSPTGRTNTESKQQTRLEDTQMDSGIVFSQRKRCTQSLMSRVGHLLVIRLLSVWAAC